MHRIKHGFDRRYGVNIFGRPNSPIEKRKHKPGQHGKNPKRKVSNYSIKLTEKQKIKVAYNVSEKQLKNLFRLSKKNTRLDPGISVIAMLERRLSQVVYRLGFAPTPFSARQLVSHGHFTVNGKYLNIPSALVSEGDVIAVRQASQHLEIIQRSADSVTIPSYLKLDGKFAGSIVKYVENLEEVPSAFELKPSYVVEEYSRSV